MPELMVTLIFWWFALIPFMVLSVLFVEQVTRAIVRGIFEERSAAIRRTYVSERKREDDGS